MIRYKKSRQSAYKFRIKSRQIIITFPKRSAEYALDNYFIANYNKTLTQLCLQIWANIKFLTNSSGEIVLVLYDKDLCKLAQFITFGNREIRGSKILQEAFKK